LNMILAWVIRKTVTGRGYSSKQSYSFIWRFGKIKIGKLLVYMMKLDIGKRRKRFTIW